VAQEERIRHGNSFMRPYPTSYPPSEQNRRTLMSNAKPVGTQCFSDLKDPVGRASIISKLLRLKLSRFRSSEFFSEFQKEFASNGKLNSLDLSIVEMLSQQARPRSGRCGVCFVLPTERQFNIWNTCTLLFDCKVGSPKSQRTQRSFFWGRTQTE
jgi:hypothetical protein